MRYGILRDLKKTMNLLNNIEYNSWFRKKLLMFFSLIIGLVTIMEIWAVNRLATFGSEISKLEAAKASLQMENIILENQIAEKASLKQIEESSKKFGFVKTNKIEYLQQSGIALNK